MTGAERDGRKLLGCVVPALIACATACGSGGGGSGADPDGGAQARPDPAYPVFDPARVHDVVLTMSADDWQSIINDTEGDTERHATLTYDGVMVGDVGVHPSGESSRFPGNPKMSVRVGFDSFGGAKFAGLTELKLKGQWDDNSMMRDGLAKFVYRSIIPTGDETYARVVVNGDLRGLYAVQQMWNPESLKQQNYADPIGPLYRIRGVKGTDPYAYLGDNTGAYTPLPWEQHVNNPARGDDVIPAFLKTIQASPLMIDTVEDVETLLGYLAATTLAMNVDCMVGDSGVEDHYQYFDPVTGKFFVLPWDPDKSFSYNGDPATRSIYADFETAAPTLIIRDDGDFRPRYKTKISALIAKTPASAVQAEVDRVYNLIKDVAHEDPVKRFDNGTFDWASGYIKTFIGQRYQNVQDQVANGP